MSQRALVIATAFLLAAVITPLHVPSADEASSDAGLAATTAEATNPALDDAMRAVANAEAVVESCADCHEISGPGYAGNPHSVINRDGDLALHLGVESSCSGCHGDGAEHIEQVGEPGTLFNFGADTPAVAKTERCLTCHADAHPRFLATSHAQSGLACTDCHAIHTGAGPDLLLPPTDEHAIDLVASIGAASETCTTCHGEALAQFQFNERHRLQEGILACNDCHDPHTPSSRLNLGGFKASACIDCHQDKGGPFVFEHGSQIIEGCVACHAPHGSPNRHMLTTQSVADLCYSCHVTVPGFHTRFNNETVCTNCHSTIHGSNFDAAFLE